MMSSINIFEGISAMSLFIRPLWDRYYSSVPFPSSRMEHCIKLLNKIEGMYQGKAYIVSGCFITVLIIQEA
jgi:hypothetical protein